MIGEIIGFASAVVVSIVFPKAWSKIVIGARWAGNMAIPAVQRLKIAIEKQES